MTTLSPKQALFAEEYLVDLNATQAAIRAGYSPRTAKQQGARLLTNADVQAVVAARQAKRVERLEITADRVLQEWARIAFADIRKVLTPGGNVMDPQDWDDDTAAAVSSLEVVTRQRPGEASEELEGQGHGGALKRSRQGAEVEYVHKFRMHDKLAALGKLGDHLAIAIKRTEHSGPNGGPIPVNANIMAALAVLTPDERVLYRALLTKLEGAAA